MELLKNIDENSLLIASNQDKLSVLNYLSANSMFLNLEFYNSKTSFLKFDQRYFFYLLENFKIEPYLAERIKKYFDYIDVEKSYRNPKVNRLQEIKLDLINKGIIKSKNTCFNKIYSVNDSFVPSFLKGNFEALIINEYTTSPVKLVQARDKLNMCYGVYEEVISLIEKGVSLDKIHILNSLEEDEILLTKLFNDALIPYNLRKSRHIDEYPFVINLIKILKTKTFEEAKKYLADSFDVIGKSEVIRIFNAYPESLIKKNIDCFIYELKKIKIKREVIKNALEIVDFNSFISKKDHYYLVMNYYDEVFPRKYLDNDYLSNNEALEVDYPSSHELNKHEKENTISILKTIDNLILFMPKEVIEKTREPNLDLDRVIVRSDYEYITNNKSYLNDLLYLEYAKKKYRFLKYNIADEDLKLLHSTFKDNLSRYIPYFSGINQIDLQMLISKKNTLSAYKLESYAKCPFSFLLNFLLEVDDFKESIFTFIGNVTHKALEDFLNNGSYDLQAIMNDYEFPEDESHKYEVYREVIKDNVEMIKEVVNDFHKTSRFEKILTEHSIKQDFNEDFKLSGVVDKVMIDEEYKYYLVVDYKYSGKDFKKEDLTKVYNIQLPLYLYALKKLYPDYNPAAMLYQQTALIKEKRGEELDYRMKGMVINSVGVVKRIDPTVTKIVGVKVKEDDTLKESKNTIISIEDMNKLLEDTRNNIENIALRIKSGDFTIEPLLEDYDAQSKNYIACKYCKFGSICYSKNKHLGGE